MTKRFPTFLFMSFLLFFGLLPQVHPHPDNTANATDVVSIPDPNLKSVIQAELRRSTPEELALPITVGDLRSMIRLDGVLGKPIADLTGVEHVTTVTFINFFKQSVGDLTPIAGLTQLEKLSFRENQTVVDLTPLAGLTALRFLELNDNQVVDVTPLKSLTNLEILDLSQNPVRLGLAEALPSLSKLKYLSLDRTPITDLSVLKSLHPDVTLLLLDVRELGPEGTRGWVLKDLEPLRALVDSSPGAKFVRRGESRTSPDPNFRFNSRLVVFGNYRLDYESLYTHIPFLISKTYLKTINLVANTIGYTTLPPSLVPVSAETHVGRPGTRYTFVVRAVNTTRRRGQDYVNRRFEKVPVLWTVTSSDIEPVEVLTGADGLSRFSLTLGEHGQEYTVTAEVPAKTNAQGPSHLKLGPITFTVTSDRNAPIPEGLTVTFEDYPEKPPTKEFPLTIRFSEAVTDFQIEDITVETELKQGSGDATLKALTPVEVPAETYTATIQVPPEATGSVSLIVHLGAALGSISGQFGPAENTASELIPFGAGATHTTDRILTRCGLGWAPQSQFQHHRELPKVMIYALEFEYDPARNAGYTCKAIEIRTGDDAIENLAGWKLYLGKLYNPARDAVKIPEAHSQVTDGILRLTPEMLDLETFPCNTAYLYGNSHPVPGFHYVLWTDENVLVDVAYSCFIWGQNAYTTVNDVNVESPRRVSSAGLREMEVPRLERYISTNTDTFIFTTYMAIEELTWDRAVLSDWLLPEREDAEVGSPSAPSLRRNLGTTWGALKK